MITRKVVPLLQCASKSRCFGGWTKQGHSLSNAFSSDPKWILPRGFHTSFTRLAKDSVDAEAKKATDAKKKKDAIKVVPKIKSPLIFCDSVKSHKYITPFRAVEEYMITYNQLEQLPKYFSRSPYSYETRILVYHRDDVEALAYKYHGNKETLELRLQRAKEERRDRNRKIFDLKRTLKFFRNSENAEVLDNNRDYPDKKGPRIFLQSESGLVVTAAIAINSANILFKGLAWWYTGSKALFSEMLHSIADTLNQVILAIGLQGSLQRPNEEHPYGYQSMRNISSLISGVGIFCIGAGLSLHHGVMGLIHPEEMMSFTWGFVVLGGSFISESVTLALAYKHAQRSAAAAKISVWEYIREGIDPTTNVVLLEDTAAVLGVVVAAASMSVSAITGNPLWDAMGACTIGLLLGSVAYFIIGTNSQTLIGKSIPKHQQDAIMRVIERHKIIRGTYDVKATLIGGDHVRFKAEVDIDGTELTLRYLETLPLDKLLKEMKAVETEEGAARFLIDHGENIVNILGAEINNIEATIKKEFPTVKHIDIEIN